MDTPGAMGRTLAVLLLLAGLAVSGGGGAGAAADGEPRQQAGAGAAGAAHSRQKRLLWVTNDGRLALPPGTALTITPTISMPFVRYPPDGFLSNMSISLPFTIVFDRLGLTDNENPYGVLPSILGRSLSRTAGEVVADYIGELLSHRRRTREAETPPPVPPRPPGLNLHGGERALLYTVVEDLLDNFGMDGKACLLRAICEVHGRSAESLRSLGVLGEMLRLFLTASKSPFSVLLPEYVQAERAGAGDGECWPYFRDCPKSIFRPPRKDMYSAEGQPDGGQEMRENVVM
ncbi:Transmembrane and immunoglobulin domain-containing protein 1 [Frankliniella fusca]|uniref:Transmembrane and immunoglobulin domain-containing protein 1 n=1 Tax=Frankliniella fusca TaxID=407009 RepID=A0AAE1HLX6_9NEOP|nr:Transmembrane and immunoglobulin domain-containing protein 1 [Frankliniella fusca]